MPRFLVLDGENKVMTAILADTKEDAETLMQNTCIEVSPTPGGPGLGWTWNGTDFIKPEPVEEPVEEPTEGSI